MIPAKVIFKGQNGITFSLHQISVLIPTGVKINNEFVKKKTNKKKAQQNLTATCEHKHAQSVKKKVIRLSTDREQRDKEPG